MFNLTALPTLPREAALAASLLLRLVSLGVTASEDDTDAADRELERLRRRFPEVADELSNWHAENV